MTMTKPNREYIAELITMLEKESICIDEFLDNLKEHITGKVSNG